MFRSLLVVLALVLAACGPGVSEDTTARSAMAPDFTLELADGGRYTLYEGEKPVYLIFWAEW